MAGGRHDTLALDPAAVAGPHDIPQEFHHPLPVDGVEGAGGFVGQHDRRLCHQCPGDGTPLLLASGEGVRPVPGLGSHPHRLERVAGGGRGTTGIEAVEDQRQGDVLLQREFRKQVVPLEDEPDPPAAHQRQLVVGQAGEVGALQQDRSAGGPRDAAEEVQQRALPRA